MSESQTIGFDAPVSARFAAFGQRAGVRSVTDPSTKWDVRPITAVEQASCMSIRIDRGTVRKTPDVQVLSVSERGTPRKDETPSEDGFERAASGSPSEPLTQPARKKGAANGAEAQVQAAFVADRRAVRRRPGADTTQRAPEGPEGPTRSQLREATRTPRHLAETLRRLPPEGRHAYVQAIARDPELAKRAFGGGAPRFDADRQTIGEAFRDAREAGAISDSDVRGMVKNLPASMATDLVVTLRAADNNDAVLEAVGEAAREKGEASTWPRVRDLALTGSQALTEKHYPTREARRAAFENLSGWIDGMSTDRNRLPPPMPVGSVIMPPAPPASRASEYSRAGIESLGRLVDPADPEQMRTLRARNDKFPKAGPAAARSLMAEGPAAARNLALTLAPSAEAAEFVTELVEAGRLEEIYPTAEARSIALEQVTGGLRAREGKLGLDKLDANDPTFNRYSKTAEYLWTEHGAEMLDSVTSPGTDVFGRDKYARLDELRSNFRYFMFSPHTPADAREKAAEAIERWVQAQPIDSPDAMERGRKVGLVLSSMSKGFQDALGDVRATGYLSPMQEFFARFLGKTGGNLVADGLEALFPRSIRSVGDFAVRELMKGLGAAVDSGLVTSQKIINPSEVQKVITEQFVRDLEAAGGGDVGGDVARRVADSMAALSTSVNKAADRLEEQGRSEEAAALRARAQRITDWMTGFNSATRAG